MRLGPLRSGLRSAVGLVGASVLGASSGLVLVGAWAAPAGAEPSADAGGAALPESGQDLVRPEPVYASGERPRADGPVQASVADEELARWNVGGRGDPAYPSNRPGFHAAPRVMVDVAVRRGELPVRSSQKGVLSETAVLAQTRNHGYWPFRLCFEAGLRKDPKLRGKSQLRVVFGTSGRAHASRLVATELTDTETARCLAARAAQLKFTPPPARPLRADIDVELSPGDVPLPALALGDLVPPPPTAPPLDVRGLETTLIGAIAPARACYGVARQADPRLWGRILFRVDIDRHGNVTAREHESRFPDPEVVRCAISAVQALPLAQLVPGPTSFTWGMRFGWPPSSPPNQAENGRTATAAHSPVAESPAPRVRVAP